MLIYIAAAPGDLRKASAFHRRFAHVAYRIGPDCQLQQQNLLMKTSGGILGLSDLDCPPITAPERLCRQLRHECAVRNYSGILADFEQPPTPDRISFFIALQTGMNQDGRTLYLPEEYASHVPNATAVICTALSGGQYRRRLEEALSKFPRAALDVQRLRMDFSVPSPTGMGQPLSPAAWEQLLAEQNPSVFFSDELCVRYFTYTSQGTGHFVLFDDAETLRRKIRLGKELGFSAAFLTFPETEDLLPQLFRRDQER